MKTREPLSLILAMMAFINFSFAQCPESIKCVLPGANPPIGYPDHGALRFYDADGVYSYKPSIAVVTVDPENSYNGTYTYNYNPYNASPNNIGPYLNFVEFEASCPDPMQNVITVELNNEYRCKYQSGNLIQEDAIESDECDDWIKFCTPELVDFIIENYEGENCQQWFDACDINSHIFREGKVGIGTNVVSGAENLAVDGGVIADEVFIQLCESGSWCDYVFDEEYCLMSLPNLQEYIQINGHLPKTKSAAEIEGEGSLELRETILNQQEKIEELFLHLVNTNETIELLKRELETINKENALLEKRVK